MEKGDVMDWHFTNKMRWWRRAQAIKQRLHAEHIKSGKLGNDYRELNPNVEWDEAQCVLGKDTVVRIPLWKCSKCGEDITGNDIGWWFLLTSKRIKDTEIRCLRCRNVDGPGKIRDYQSRYYKTGG